MPSGIAITGRKFQFGQESTWGTAVAGTAILGGVLDGSLRALDTVELPEDLGRYGPGAVALEMMQNGAVSINAVASYEDLMYFTHGAFGSVSPTGAGPYVYAYSAPTSSAPTAQKSTIEFGIGSSAYKLAGAVLTKFGIKGSAGKYWTASGEWMGKAVSTVTFASLSDRTWEGIRGADTTFHVDSWGGTIGTTAAATTLIDFELDVDTGRHMKYFMGAIGPGDYGESRWSGSLKTTLEYNSTTKAYFDAMIAPALVQRQLQIKATSGTKISTIQFAGTLDGNPIELFKDRDGNAIVELTWKGTYNSTLGNWLKMSLTNGVSAYV